MEVVSMPGHAARLKSHPTRPYLDGQRVGFLGAAGAESRRRIGLKAKAIDINPI
jgi:hypothetical protein